MRAMWRFTWTRNAAEIGHWQRLGQSLMLQAGKTAPLELRVNTP